MRRLVLLVLVLALLAGGLVLLWPAAEMPPNHLVQKYGYPSPMRPTGRTVTVEGSVMLVIRHVVETLRESGGFEESELLAFASTLGSLSLVLRGYQDLEVVRDVPEKGMDDVWEAERRNALQERPGNGSKPIERLKVR